MIVLLGLAILIEWPFQAVMSVLAVLMAVRTGRRATP